ncbi:MAG: ribokinase [Rickettsiales bacterium]|nr:ribokinase [Rickettsiales bacterium]OUW05492.1 MAG: hypothetical protein CBD16_00925 [Betaproteobacteria bacterium TMED156]
MLLVLIMMFNKNLEEKMGNNIIVVGIFVVDISIYSKTLPLPGQTIIGNNYIIGPGGKGSNQSVAIAKAGGKVSLIARIGDDDFGKVALKLYDEVGVDTNFLSVEKNERTGCATISIDEEGMNAIIVAPSSANGLTPEMILNKKNAFKSSKTVITGFEIPLETTIQSLKIGREFNCLNVLNPAPYSKVNKEIWSLVDYVTPNEHEAYEITGIKVKNPEDAFIAGEKLCEMGSKNAVITLGSLGAVTVINGKRGKHYLPPKISGNVLDTVGAGDVFNGTFSLSITKGKSIEESVQYANLASSISVRRKGAANSSPDALEIEKNLNLIAG